YKYHSKYLFVFLSGGGSYIDKFLPILFAKFLGKIVVIFPVSGHLIADHKRILFKYFIDIILKYSNHVICQSMFWKEYFSSKDVNENKLYIIENWVDNTAIIKSKSINFPTYSSKNKE